MFSVRILIVSKAGAEKVETFLTMSILRRKIVATVSRRMRRQNLFNLNSLTLLLVEEQDKMASQVLFGFPHQTAINTQ